MFNITVNKTQSSHSHFRLRSLNMKTPPCVAEEKTACAEHTKTLPLYFATNKDYEIDTVEFQGTDTSEIRQFVGGILCLQKNLLLTIHSSEK